MINGTRRKGALAAALILVCGAADRIIGWGEWGRTKPVIATVAALSAVAYFAHMPWPAIVAFWAAFMVWRTPGWHFLGGTINPEPEKAIGTFWRHSLAQAFLVPAYLAGASLWMTALCMLGFAVVATLLGVWNYYKQAHINHTVEALRGLALGVSLSFPFIVFAK